MSRTITDFAALPASKAGAAQSWHAVLLKAVSRGIARIMEKHRRRRDIDVLLALDDRMLADIGLHRFELEYAARHGRCLSDISVHGDR